MKVSKRWLLEFIDSAQSAEALDQQRVVREKLRDRFGDRK